VDCGQSGYYTGKYSDIKGGSFAPTETNCYIDFVGVFLSVSEMLLQFYEAKSEIQLFEFTAVSLQNNCAFLVA
jgi:hypothetical protein